MLPETVSWKGDHLDILDQRKLPGKVSFLECVSVEDVAQAIETLAVRGAPAIGIAAAYGMVLANPENQNELDQALRRLQRTRPTAVNLFWALNRMKRRAEKQGFCREDLLEEARAIHREDIETNRRIGFWGQTLLPDEAVVMTHCNAGALATGGYGTALGVIRAAREQKKSVSVFACEARPVLQGARLTAWELAVDGFDVTLICDGAAAWVMKSARPDAVIVGADRIAANGDTANKIGTYALALAADRHGIPFYVAAPSSTIDITCTGGDDIPIETRKAEEIRRLPESGLVPEQVEVYNPAFDVTPASLVTAFFTETGVLKPPYGVSIRRCLEQAAQGKGTN
ncbi:MAG: S-methyl-5-thioribose-1-phosphate isomerase [Thermovirgaceae bacterium]